MNRLSRNNQMLLALVAISAILISIFSFCTNSAKPDSTHQTNTPTVIAKNKTTENQKNSPDLVDKRDGQIYKTLKIGDQTWMASNLKFKSPNSYCYNNNPADCSKSGRFYIFKEAMTACPKGWHLPTDEDWKMVESNLGMEKDQLDTIRIWRGTKEGNQLKDLFKVVFPGIGESKGKEFQGKNVLARYWSATAGPSGEQFAIYRQVMKSKSKIYSDQMPKMNLCCARCLKD